MKEIYTQNLIVGLGNDGDIFILTRHNIGFDVLDCIEKGIGWHKGPYYNWHVSAKLSSIMIKPTTGMNLSGVAVKYAISTYNIHNVIVVHDDLDLDPGIIKIKSGGGDGGHNGIKSIINKIGPGFIRVKVGIGKPTKKEKGIQYVLNRFSKKERKLIDNAIILTAEAIEYIVKNDIQKAMNKYNKRKI